VNQHKRGKEISMSLNF